MDRRGVFVVGMHRSGTSAATRVLNLLGLAVCRPDDLMGPGRGNERGHWESVSMMYCNEVLLDVGGGRWLHPPADPEWLRASACYELAPAGREVFGTVHPDGPWVCKDPRFCLTLPFWRWSLDSQLCGVVIMVRHPAEVALSHRRRDDMPIDDGLRLWEHHTRWALAFSAGLPALVTSYERLLEDPDGWCAEGAAFLARLGFGLGEPRLVEVYEFLSEDLRTARPDDAAAVEVSSEQRVLLDRCRELAGTHLPLGEVKLPDETPGLYRRPQGGSSGARLTGDSPGRYGRLRGPAAAFRDAAMQLLARPEA